MITALVIPYSNVHALFAFDLGNLFLLNINRVDVHKLPFTKYHQNVLKF